MRPNRPRKDPALPASPLSAQRNALQEEERRVQEQVARYEKLLEDAPKLAAQRQKARREEHINRVSRLDKRAGGVAQLQDRRIGLDANVAAPAQHRRMRAERRQGRLMFFVLLLALAASTFYLYYTVTRS